MRKLLVAASSTRDIVGGAERLGGPAYFIGTALHLLGADALVATGTGPVSDYLRGLHGIAAAAAGHGETVFSIEVDGYDRRLRLMRRSMMNPSLEGGDAFVVSATMSEIPWRFVRDASDRGPTVVDIQGFVREVDGDGVVRNSVEESRRLLEGLAGVEGVVVRGERYEFPPECWGTGIIRCAMGYDIALAITNAEMPFYVADPRSGLAYEGFPIQGLWGEPIGLGDVFTAALAFYMFVEGRPLPEASALASAAATIKLRDKHPWFTPSEVEEAAGKVRMKPIMQ